MSDERIAECDAFAKRIGQDHYWAYSPDKTILEDWAHKGPWSRDPAPGPQWRRCTNCGRMEEFTLTAPEVPETVYKAVERVLDEHSAWIARPSNEVTKAVALAAGIAWSLQAAPETLPPCMEPDGGSCCPQFRRLTVALAARDKEIAELWEEAAKIAKAKAEYYRAAYNDPAAYTGSSLSRQMTFQTACNNRMVAANEIAAALRARSALTGEKT